MQLGLLGAQLLFLAGAAFVAIAPASSRHSKLLESVFFVVVSGALVTAACDHSLQHDTNPRVSSGRGACFN